MMKTVFRSPSRRRLVRLGFKGTGMFGGGSLYYKVIDRRVWFVDVSGCVAGHFDLTAPELRAFLAGKLSLVPAGYLNVLGGRVKTIYTPCYLYEALAS